MLTETLQRNASPDQMLVQKAGEGSADRLAAYELRCTLSETIVEETGYAEFLAALRANSHSPA
jgi:hypothetical protein